MSWLYRRTGRGDYLNKAEFFSFVSERSGIPRYKLRDAFDAIADGILEAIRTGETVQINGFGVFTVKLRKKRKGRNKWTGELINVPSKKYPYFSPGTLFQKALEDGKDNWHFDEE